MQFRSIAVSLVTAAVFATQANAALLAKDSYVIGAPPTGYTNNASINSASNAGLVTYGYATGAYGGGTGTTNFQATTGTLNQSSLSAVDGGKVAYLGLSAGSVGTRTTARNLSPSITTTPSVYYTAQLINRGSNITGYIPAAGAFVGTGYTNNATPTTSGSTNGTQFGFLVGFAGTDGTTDAGSVVIRGRAGTTANGIADTVIVDGKTTSTENATYLVIVKAEANYTGGTADRLTYWVNPTDTSSESAMSTSSLSNGTFDYAGLQGTSDLLRQLYASTGTNDATGTGSFRNTAFFDEIRLGTDLGSVVPEPTTLAALGAAGAMFGRRRRG